MKKRLYIFTLIGFVALNACGPTYVVQRPAPPPPPPVAEPAPPPPPAPEPEPEGSYQSFYDDLSPYGQWIDDPRYGYVWLPDVGPDFKPYATNGHWVYTEDGWTWASDYQWGWAAFHYGRWFFSNGYGWMWVPGNEWAPAWVTWRNSNDYYGWAPMEPGVNVDYAYGGGYNPPSHYWCFVPHQYVSSPYVRNYYVNESRNVTIINQTTVINNTTIINNNVHTRNVNYGRGPDPYEVGRYTNTNIRPMPIRTINRPGQQVNNNAMVIYRPRINEASRNNAGSFGSARPAPNRAIRLDNARPVNTTVYENNRPGSRPVSGFPNRPAQQPAQPVGRPFQQPAQPFQQQPAQPVNQPVTRPFVPGRPATQQPAQQPVQQPSQPVQQPANPVNRPDRPWGRPFQQPAQQPAQQSSQPVQQPAQPVGRPFQQPAQPVQQSPAQPVNQPVTRPFMPTRPVAQPATQPVQQQTARPIQQQPQPVNRPAYMRPYAPAQQPPAAQPQARPVTRTVTPPPSKPDEDKNTRPTRQ